MIIHIKEFNYKKKNPKNLNNNRFQGFKNLNLTFKDGSIIGLVGNNGSGKTTLLKILAGILIEPPILKNKKIFPLINMVSGIDEEFNAEENIYHLMASYDLLKKKKYDDFIDDVIIFAELQNERDKLIKDYSNGMIARLVLSFCLNTNFDYYLIDESVSTLDKKFLLKISSKIKEMAKQKKIFLIASHNNEIINNLCNQLINFNNQDILITNNNDYKKNI